MTRSKILRQAIQDCTGVSLFLEAHNGISAKIVEKSGANGVWASGFTMSAAMGVRDANELSWTQVLDILESMSNCTNIPILVDGDTGHGNFNNARIFVKKLCLMGIAGVVYEDKLFPKMNSFVTAAHSLVDIDNFCGKIKACKDSQTDNDFCIIARTEALIANLGMDEAIKRASFYIEAGADAIVIHSKKDTPVEILEFCKKWNKKAPVIIIPTKYEASPIVQFQEMGVTGIIFANHLMRASIKVMNDICQNIMKHHKSTGLEIASVEDIFTLTNMQALIEDEKKYL
ncbi:MAG: phosphoenolpyruvate mutase [Chlamydiae bacterium]|nr:phosphoenolpyruvate mutase [Chlamydiota bacterium]